MSSLRLGIAVVAYSRDAQKVAYLSLRRVMSRAGSFDLSGDWTRCATIRPVSRNFLRRFGGFFAYERSLNRLKPRCQRTLGFMAQTLLTVRPHQAIVPFGSLTQL